MRAYVRGDLHCEFHPDGGRQLIGHVPPKADIAVVAGGCRWVEASWVLEDNQLSDESVRSALVPRRYKTYRIYEKPLPSGHPGAPFGPDFGKLSRAELTAEGPGPANARVAANPRLQ
jgi:hypothetical protein